MRFMTDTQCAYIAGQSKELPLGGVGCHAYFEFRCGTLDEEKLAYAWKQLFVTHSEMRAGYADGIIVDSNELPVCSNVEIIECTETECKRFREEHEARIINTREHECCGLWYLKTGLKYNILAFDWTLVAGDVKSFVLVLDELCSFYNGELVDANQSGPLLDLRKKFAGDTKAIAEQIISEDIAKFPIRESLVTKADVEELSSCNYKAADRWIALSEIRKDFDDSHLMSAFVNSVCEITGDNGFLINYPCFRRSQEEWKAIGDFTDIKLIPMPKDYEEGIKVYDRYMSFSGYKQIKVRRKISKAFPDAKNIAPIVFSPVVDRPLITNEFIKTIGTLSYMISQTPQVWLDVQTFIVGEELYISVVYPDELFEEEYVKKIADGYVEKIKIYLKEV